MRTTSIPSNHAVFTNHLHRPSDRHAAPNPAELSRGAGRAGAGSATGRHRSSDASSSPGRAVTSQKSCKPAGFSEDDRSSYKQEVGGSSPSPPIRESTAKRRFWAQSTLERRCCTSNPTLPTGCLTASASTTKRSGTTPVSPSNPAMNPTSTMNREPVKRPAKLNLRQATNRPQAHSTRPPPAPLATTATTRLHSTVIPEPSSDPSPALDLPCPMREDR
jgi:hypothetical protein